jgi:hopanoid-associated phosphorylase
VQEGNSVIAAVGLAFEARIAAGPGVTVLGRGGRGGLAASVERAIRQGCRGIVSFGIAGGLAQHLKPGSFVVGSAVIDVTGERWPTCPQWSGRLLQALPGAIHAPIAGSEGPVAHPAVKRLMHKKTGAAIVDMESHLAARLAARHGIAFAALRVVCDPAHRALPSAALAGMRSDGSTDGFAVLRGLAVRPSTVPGVMLTALDAAAARANLQRCRKLAGLGFGLLEPAAAAPLTTIPALPVAESQPA